MNSKNYKAYRKNLENKNDGTHNGKLLSLTLERHSLDSLPEPKRQIRICPDCGQLLHYNSHHKRFNHSPFSDCYYEENVYGQCLYSNKIREAEIEKNKNLI